MHPQGVCRIRKPAYAGNGCAIFPVFQTEVWEQKIRYPAADDLFRVSLVFCLFYHTPAPLDRFFFVGYAPIFQELQSGGKCGMLTEIALP